MIDISVKDLVKSFDADTNLLDGVSFDVQEGERVGLLGQKRRGQDDAVQNSDRRAGLQFRRGALRARAGKVGLISQIPVLSRRATPSKTCCARRFRELDERIQNSMRQLEGRMAAHPDEGDAPAANTTRLSHAL